MGDGILGVNNKPYVCAYMCIIFRLSVKEYFIKRVNISKGKGQFARKNVAKISELWNLLIPWFSRFLCEK